MLGTCKLLNQYCFLKSTRIYGISSLTQVLCWVLMGMPKKVDCCSFLKDVKPREDSRMVFSPMKPGQGVGEQGSVLKRGFQVSGHCGSEY